MSTALGSAAATLALWFGLTVGVFLLVGWSFAWVVRAIIPPHQERLPRHLWIGACLLATLFIGGSSGLNVGASQAVLAFGDALTARPDVEFVVITPWPSEDQPRSIVQTAREFPEAMAEEGGVIRARGVIRYLIGHLFLGQLYEPALTAKAIGASYLKAEDDTLVSSRRVIGAWLQARPELDRIALRQIAGSLFVGVLHLAGLLLAGLLMVLFSWREMRGAVQATARDRSLHTRIREDRDVRDD